MATLPKGFNLIENNKVKIDRVGKLKLLDFVINDLMIKINLDYESTLADDTLTIKVNNDNLTAGLGALGIKEKDFGEVVGMILFNDLGKILNAYLTQEDPTSKASYKCGTISIHSYGLAVDGDELSITFKS